MEDVFAVAAVSFLNTVPLVAELSAEPRVRLRRAVPSALASLLRGGEVEAALLPVVDLRRIEPPPRVLGSAGCIASDGPTLTVQVLARVEPTRVRRLAADPDSHTSVVLAQVLWREMFGVLPALCEPDDATADAALRIGDKVVTAPPQPLLRQLDLGQLWRQWTGLPFVFAVWAARGDLPAARAVQIERLLGQARDRALPQLDRLAEIHAPAHRWPTDLARRYFRDHMQYVLTARHRQGMDRFLDLAAALDLKPEQ